MNPVIFSATQNTLAGYMMVAAIAGAVGMMFLLPAFDGASVHGFGTLGNLSVKGRYVALVGGNVVMFFPLGLLLIHTDFSFVDLWSGAQLFWEIGTYYTYAGAIAVWGLMLSPLLSLISVIRIELMRRRLA